MRPDRFRLAGWLVSGLCLAASAGLIVNRHAAFVATAAAETRASADLQRAREEAEAIAGLPKERRFACAPHAQDEETAFLLDLRRRAHACGVSISRWSSHTTTYEKKEGEKAEPTDAVLKGVTKVSCSLGLLGPYPALRAFLADLWNADRLLTVSHVDWTRTEKGSELSMSIGRYLAPEKDAPKP